MSDIIIYIARVNSLIKFIIIVLVSIMYIQFGDINFNNLMFIVIMK